MRVLYKDDRNLLITNIINEINIVIIENINKKESLSNLNRLSKLNFLEDIDNILERQYEIYKEDILIDVESIIESTIDDFEECISNAENGNMIKSTEYQLELINELKDSLFDNIEESYIYELDKKHLHILTYMLIYKYKSGGFNAT